MLDVYPTYQTVSDAVFYAHWQLTANDGLGRIALASGTQKLGPIDTQNFTPFANLTLTQVQTWVEAQMGTQQIAEIKSHLDAQIANQINPPTATLASPWS